MSKLNGIANAKAAQIVVASAKKCYRILDGGKHTILHFTTTICNTLFILVYIQALVCLPYDIYKPTTVKMYVKVYVAQVSSVVEGTAKFYKNT